MKNRILFFSLIICLFQIHRCNAQLIDNKINIYAGYYAGVFHGEKLIQKGNFKFPSFYNNLNNINGLCVKFLYHGSQYLSYGMDISISNASKWNHDNNDFYLESQVNMQSLALPIQLHNKYSQHGFFNRFKVHMEFSPIIGLSSFSSSKELFDILGIEAKITTPTVSSDIYYGFSGSTGMEYAFSQTIGMFVSYSLQYNRIKSILYSDDYFSFSRLKVGFVLKLMNDKTYLYRN
jgi:hypothetical protein